jgi:hypothetical protein
MPFISEIVSYINEELKGGSLNKEKLQPGKYFGLSTTVFRSKSGSKEQEQLPAFISASGKIELITPDQKLALQVYHKCTRKAYTLVKKGSVGDSYDYKMTADMQLVVIINTGRTGKAKDMLEPVLVFGLPQRLNSKLMNDLKIGSCLITVVDSVLDHYSVSKSEYPQSPIFFNEAMGIFMIRYKIETTFSQACVDACLCQP